MAEAALDLEDGQLVDGEITDPIVDDEKVVEPWQEVGDETADVNVHQHIKMKDKLKGRISDRDEEIDRLQAENEQLRNTRTTPPVVTGTTKKPVADDFDTDEQYQTAYDKWDDERLDAKVEARELTRQQNRAASQATENLQGTVDTHYERAAKLVEETGISSEIFQQSDSIVRKAIEAVRPKQGNLIVDQMISILGEGSEKVFYYLGRNKPALDRVKGLLAEDPSGMKAAVFLGKQKERLTNPKKITSNAPPPAPNANGDIVSNVNGAALKRKYDAAHGKGKGQEAYNIKKEARAAGVDVKSW